MRGQSFPRNNDLEKRYVKNPDTYTKLFLRGDKLEDLSGTFKVVNNNGVILSATQSKINGLSMYFDGNSYLSIPDSDDWDFGSGDFTIEHDLFPTAYSNILGIFGQSTASSSGAFSAYRYSDNLITYQISAGTLYISVNQSNIPLNSWTHVAFTRSNGYINLFANKTKIGTKSVGTVAITNVSAPLLVGMMANTAGIPNKYVGYMSGFKISKGIDLYSNI